MKCPKCGYLGYAQADRCRNCGYEFVLTEPDADDLRLNDRTLPLDPIGDLELVDDAAIAREETFGAGAAPSRRRHTPNAPGELPLFGSPIADDEPLITKVSPPRTPLSVRRATPDVPRLRTEPRAPMLEWSDSAQPTPSIARDDGSPEVLESRTPRRPRSKDLSPLDPAEPEPAAIGSRAMATAIDMGLLLVVDLLVVYFTMKICRVTLSEIAMLPRAPLFAFLLLQNGGYVIAFTATGQTLGKMIAGVRVLADDEGRAPDLGRSALRAVVWLVLALPAGAGLLATLLMRDGRGLHDRCAGTRVVRAGA